MALLTDVHSVLPKRILNHFLFLFFKDIFLYSQMAVKVSNRVMGKAINQNFISLYIPHLLFQNQVDQNGNCNHTIRVYCIVEDCNTESLSCISTTLVL